MLVHPHWQIAIGSWNATKAVILQQHNLRLACGCHQTARRHGRHLPIADLTLVEVIERTKWLRQK